MYRWSLDEQLSFDSTTNVRLKIYKAENGDDSFWGCPHFLSTKFADGLSGNVAKQSEKARTVISLF